MVNVNVKEELSLRPTPSPVCMLLRFSTSNPYRGFPSLLLMPGVHESCSYEMRNSISWYLESKEKKCRITDKIIKCPNPEAAVCVMGQRNEVVRS